MVPALVVGALIVVVVLLIAAAAVLRESVLMESDPPTRAFDMEEAVAWVVRHIPDEVAATLTLDDVEVILGLQLDYFRRKGVSRNGKTAVPPGSVVVGGSETVDYILTRAVAAGHAHLTPPQVHAVIDTQLTYLRSLGVVGRAVEDFDDGAGEPPENS